MNNAPKIKKCDTINIHGTDFVGYKELIYHAHQCGIKSLNTEILQYQNSENKETVIVKCTLRTNDDAVYTSIGDANPSNVNASCACSYIRVAEIRAKSRAISDAFNVKNSIEDDYENQISASHEPQGASQKRQQTASGKQLKYASALLVQNDIDPEEYASEEFNKEYCELNYSEANGIIKRFM